MEHHWKHLPDNWYEYEGFVYQITNTQTNQKYIGRKYFYSKKGTKIVKESDWRWYTSSSKKVNALIQTLGKEQFLFEILSVHRTRQLTNYAEVEAQIMAKVLTATLLNGEEEYYNDNIMSRYFRPKDFGTPEHAARCKEISVALKAGFSSGRITHPMLGKVHPNKGKKLPQTGHKKNIGYKHTEASKKKMAATRSAKPKKEYTRVCKQCLKEEKVDYTKRKTLFCSETCRQLAHSIKMKDKYKAGLSHLPLGRPKKDKV